MARFKTSAFQLNVRVSFLSIGRRSQAPNTIIQNMERRYVAQGRRSLRRAAAFARGAMRRGQRAGRVRRDGSRSRSRPGNPPHNHQGRAFGLKWIAFEPRTNDSDRYVIGPEYRRTPGARRSRFFIDRMIERGGAGDIMAPMQPIPGAAGWRQYEQWEATGNWPSTWVRARYQPRTYASRAIEPTMREFPGIWASEGRN